MSKTLLLADDSVTIQKVVGITFASEDVELVTVDNGDDALSKAREIKPDLVLADISMPGLDGYELCAAIKAEPDLSGTPVILLTGTFETFDERRTAEAGAEAHIAKPFEAQALVDLVHSLLERPTPAPAEESPAQASTEMVEDLTPAQRPVVEERPVSGLPPVRAEQPESPEDEFGFDDLDFARESESAGEPLVASAQTQVLAEIPTMDPDLLPEPSQVDPLAGEAKDRIPSDGVPEEQLLEAAPLPPDPASEEADTEPPVIEAAPDLWAADAEATVVAEADALEPPTLESADLDELPAEATVVAGLEPAASDLPELTPLDEVEQPDAAAAAPEVDERDEGKTKLLDPSAMAAFPPLADSEPAAAPALEAQEEPLPAPSAAEVAEEEADLPAPSSPLPEPDGAAIDPLPVAEIPAVRQPGDDSDIFGDPLDDTPIPQTHLADEETAPDLEADSTPEESDSQPEPLSPAAVVSDDTPSDQLAEALPFVAEEGSPDSPELEAMPELEELPALEPEPGWEPEPTPEAEEPVEQPYALEPEPAIEPDEPVETEYALELEPGPEAEGPAEQSHALQPEPAIEPEEPVAPEYALEPQPAIEPEEPMAEAWAPEPEREEPIEPEYALEPEPAVEPEKPAEPEHALEPEPAIEPEEPMAEAWAAEPEPEVEPEAPLELEALMEPEIPFEPDTEIDSTPDPELELPAEADQPLAAVAPVVDPNAVQQALEKVAWEAFGPISEQLVREVLKKLEEIAWEVVPQLAEQLVKEEIDRLKGGTDD
jgi:CheY-like chemotaxis protein